MIITSISLILVVIGWIVAFFQSRTILRMQQLAQCRDSLKELSRVHFIAFIQEPNNMNRLILQNIVELEKQTTTLLFIKCLSKHKQIRPLFDKLIEHIDEDGQKLFDKATDQDKGKFLIEANQLTLEIVELIR